MNRFTLERRIYVHVNRPNASKNTNDLKTVREPNRYITVDSRYQSKEKREEVQFFNTPCTKGLPVHKLAKLTNFVAGVESKIQLNRKNKNGETNKFNENDETKDSRLLVSLRRRIQMMIQ